MICKSQRVYDHAGKNVNIDNCNMYTLHCQNVHNNVYIDQMALLNVWFW